MRTRNMLVLLAMLVACLAFASTAAAGEGDDDGREIEFCDPDAVSTSGHREGGPEWKCFPVCVDGTTVLVKAHYKNGWRMQRFMKRHPGSTFGPCGVDEEVGGPARGIYCMNGTAADLIIGQPDEDPAWAGAVPAVYVPGTGATCDYEGPTRVGVKADGTGDIAGAGLAALMPSYLYEVAA